MIIRRGALSFDSISLDNGSLLAPVEVAYETYGELSAAKSNAIPRPLPQPQHFVTGP